MSEIIHQLSKATRFISSPMRVLPNFIIIGAQRSGTTYLYNLLKFHPSVLPAFRKEVHFFDKNYHRGLAWYKAHFPTIIEKIINNSTNSCRTITGEASPYYLFHPHTPERIRDLLPEVKLIALLRNPTDRAFSHYHFAVEKQAESRPFLQAIKEEKEMLKKETDKVMNDPHHLSFLHQMHSYLTRGLYAEQLRAWYRLFTKQKIHIILSEDLFEDPQSVFNNLYKFLSISQIDITLSQEKVNKVNYDKMDAVTRKLLTKFYRPFNRDLEKLTGISINWD